MGTLRVAAYQTPYLPFGSLDAVGLIESQLAFCEAEGVAIMCCPESVIGGLAHECDGQSPADVARSVDELTDVIRPLLSTTVTIIVGFTERDHSGRIFSSAAVLCRGMVAAVYRKVYPGYRTALSAGTTLSVSRHGSTPYGIMICNDIWYVEPARILSAAGAAVVFVPTHSGHMREPSAVLVTRGATLPIARAVENTTTIVVADIAGRQGNRMSLGCSAIVDPDGKVLASAEQTTSSLLIADVESERRVERDPRGRDGWINPDVTELFLRLWRPTSRRS